MIGDSYKKLDLMQKMDVHLCSNWAKSRNYESQMLGGEFVIIAFA
jgi:hypothetical protein